MNIQQIAVVVAIVACILMANYQEHKPIQLTKDILIPPSQVLKRIFYREGVVVPKEDKSGVGIKVEGSVKQIPKKVVVSRGSVNREIPISKEDYDALIRIVEAECTGRSVEDKMNVAQCVLNRVKEEGVYPCRIKDVIFAEGQFQPTFDGRYEKVKITNGSIEAVNKVLNNPTIHDCIYFQAHGCDSSWFKTLDFVFKDGSHKYYK